MQASQRGTPTSPESDLVREALLHEYDFVAGLIPFYRRVEITALGGAGVVVSAVLGAVATLEGRDPPNRLAEATLLSLAGWAPAMLLLLELMALTRLRRASIYIQTVLYPRAARLAEDPLLLRWEFGPTRGLLQGTPQTTTLVGGRFAKRARFLADPLVKIFVTSTPLITALVAGAVVLPLVGAALHPGGWLAPVLSAGYVAAGVGICFGVAGFWLTRSHEERATRAETGSRPVSIVVAGVSEDVRDAVHAFTLASPDATILGTAHAGVPLTVLVAELSPELLVADESATAPALGALFRISRLGAVLTAQGSDFTALYRRAADGTPKPAVGEVTLARGIAAAWIARPARDTWLRRVRNWSKQLIARRPVAPDGDVEDALEDHARETGSMLRVALRDGRWHAWYEDAGGRRELEAQGDDPGTVLGDLQKKSTAG
jgi:hypothetical protein